jgi:hypothetical protein
MTETLIIEHSAAPKWGAPYLPILNTLIYMWEFRSKWVRSVPIATCHSVGWNAP